MPAYSYDVLPTPLPREDGGASSWEGGPTAEEVHEAGGRRAEDRGDRGGSGGGAAGGDGGVGGVRLRRRTDGGALVEPSDATMPARWR